MRRILTLGGTVLLLSSVCYAFVIRPFNLHGRQITDLVLCRDYVQFIVEYHEAHGQYPPTLLAAVQHDRFEQFGSLRNAWGHPLEYQSDGSTFLLVSLGRDGKRDGSDYSALRANKAWAKVCGDWNADQVFSDQGEHRICGK